MPGLGTSFGRGGATTAQQDLANADCVLIEGSSMAEAHPVGFRWVMKAREEGATVIHVDPRYSRTSAMSDIWAPIRAGGDIAFLGGLINHVLQNDLYFEEYVRHYTNAPVILREDFGDTEDLDGLFSGWLEDGDGYETASWMYEGDDLTTPRRDPSLEHPRCVFQVLKRHFSRYTPEMVERVAGIPEETFHRIARELTENSGPEKTAAICYAVGWTQHSKGVQVIRTAAILQLLLGNIGRPGGGILALRGHASIQGSTDIPTLYDILPGYLDMPEAGEGEETLEGYLENNTKRGGLWAGTPSYMVSLLKAYYGERSTPENDWGYGWLPKITGDHSHFAFWTDMADGNVEGCFIIGQNPSVGAQNARLQRKALAELDWLVVRDLQEIEPASFWKDSPEVERGELVPEEIDTEVFLFPAAGHVEKEGAFTQTQRMLQWREKAVDPPGEARSDAWFIHQLAKRLKAKAEASDDPRDEPMRALDWWYPETEDGEPEMEAVLAEINGWRVDPEAGADDPDAAFASLEAEIDRLREAGLVFSGRHPEQPIMQVLELPSDVHPYFVAAQFHPELTGRPLRPQPLFMGLLAAAILFVLQMDSSITGNTRYNTVSSVDIHSFGTGDSRIAAPEFINVDVAVLGDMLNNHANLIGMGFQHYGGYIEASIEFSCRRSVGIFLNVIGMLVNIFGPYFLASRLKAGGTRGYE